MENAVFDRPPVSEAVVELQEETSPMRAAQPAPQGHPYWIPLALVMIAAASIASALVAGIRIANIGF